MLDQEHDGNLTSKLPTLFVVRVPFEVVHFDGICLLVGVSL